MPVPRLRRTFRRLIHAPLFAAVAALTLGIGIGANTAIFTVVNSVLLRPLPFEDADRLVGVWHSAPGLNLPLLNQSPAFYLTYREENRVFEDTALWNDWAVSVTGTGEPERVRALFVTDGLLPLLRVRPLVGRAFTAEDDSPAAPERAILAHAYWQRKFGGDPAVIGRQLTVNGRPTEIIGVMPASFRFQDVNPQLILPFRFDRAQIFVGNFSYRGIARLKPGVTIEAANADVARMIPLVPERFPFPAGLTRAMFDDVKMGPRIRPLADEIVGDVRRVLWVLLGTVAIVLLIACANVANLFLVRAEGRQQELAVHAALGAGWRHLAAELLVESVTLGVLGGAVGLALAQGAVSLLRRVAPDGLPRLEEIAIDPTVLLFTVAISLFAGALFGVIPVLKFASPNVAGALKEGGRLSSASRERHRARNALVVGQIALAVVLLVASGLLIRTFQAMRTVSPGFTRPEEVLTLRISIPESLVPDPAETARLHQRLADRLAQVPGVTSVGLSTAITMDGFDSNDPIFVEDFPTAADKLPPLRRFKWIAEGYFETMGNPVIAGRPLTWRDVHEQAPVVLINERLARELWKDPALAVGRRIREVPTNPWRTIVGVVGDERDDGPAKPAPAIVYWPMLLKQFWNEPVVVQRTLGYAIRSGRTGSPTLLKEIQQAVWSVNPDLPVASVRTLDRIRRDAMAQTSFALVMLGTSAAMALLLGLVGIYGVLAYIVNQRRREIGIRMALGAAGRDVRRMFLRQGLVLTAAGLVSGLVAAAAVTRVMSSLLFGVGALDPLTYGAVAISLAATTLLASYFPAARAAGVDPATALRSEG
jgi:putative ABC transport system permease protein